jgi:hypothetical protein
MVSILINKIKNLTKKNPSWQTLFIEMYTNDNNINFNELEYSFCLILKHKNILKNKITIDFIKNIKQENIIEKLQDEIHKIIKNHEEEKFIKSIRTNSYKKIINDDVEAALIDLIRLEFPISVLKSQIIHKISKYKDPEDLLSDIVLFKYNNDNWSLDSINSAIKTSQLNCNYYKKIGNYNIFEIHDYDASKMLGSRSWCISYRKFYFDKYKVGCNRIFFMFDFTKSELDPNSFLALTVKPSGRVDFSCNKIDVKSKIGMDFYFKPMVYKKIYDNLIDSDIESLFNITCDMDDVSKINNIIERTKDLRNSINFDSMYKKAIKFQSNSVLCFLLDNYPHPISHIVGDNSINFDRVFIAMNSVPFSYSKFAFYLLKLEHETVIKLLSSLSFNSVVYRKLYANLLEKNDHILFNFIEPKVEVDDNLNQIILKSAICSNNYNIFEEYLCKCVITNDIFNEIILSEFYNKDDNFIEGLIKSKEFKINNSSILKILNRSSSDLIFYLISKGAEFNFLDQYKTIFQCPYYTEISSLFLDSIQFCCPIKLSVHINDILDIAIKYKKNDIIYNILTNQYLGLNYNLSNGDMHDRKEISMGKKLFTYGVNNKNNFILNNIAENPHINITETECIYLLNSKETYKSIINKKELNFMSSNILYAILRDKNDHNYLLDEFSNIAHYKNYKSSDVYLRTILKLNKIDLMLDSIKFSSDNKKKLNKIFKEVISNHTHICNLINANIIGVTGNESVFLTSIYSSKNPKVFLDCVEKNKINLSNCKYGLSNISFLQFLICDSPGIITDDQVYKYLTKPEFKANFLSFLVGEKTDIIDFLLPYFSDDFSIIMTKEEKNNVDLDVFHKYSSYICIDENDSHIEEANNKINIENQFQHATDWHTKTPAENIKTEKIKLYPVKNNVFSKLMRILNSKLF